MLERFCPKHGGHTDRRDKHTFGSFVQFTACEVRRQCRENHQPPVTESQFAHEWGPWEYITQATDLVEEIAGRAYVEFFGMRIGVCPRRRLCRRPDCAGSALQFPLHDLPVTWLYEEPESCHRSARCTNCERVFRTPKPDHPPSTAPGCERCHQAV